MRGSVGTDSFGFESLGTQVFIGIKPVKTHLFKNKQSRYVSRVIISTF